MIFFFLNLTFFFYKALFSGDADSLQKEMRRLLLQSVSSLDTSHEDFYHGLLLGLCAMMNKHYETELLTHGVKTILKYGAAFSGKNVEICME